MLTIAGLTKRYAGKHAANSDLALDNVDLVVPKG